MKLQVKLNRAGCADGIYRVSAKGAIFVELRWANEYGPLEEWSAFAFLPIDPYGNGEFRFAGGRSIPPAATHIYMRSVTPQLNVNEIIVKLPESVLQSETILTGAINFSVLNDIHLSEATHVFRRALSRINGNYVLIPGDLTNNGTQEQFEKFEKCVEEIIPEKLVLPIPGNHDMPIAGSKNYYPSFARKALEHVFSIQKTDTAIDMSNGFDYAVRIGTVDVIGLQCVSEGRKLVFPNGRYQLEWLEDRLKKQAGVSWHIIQCHAPLLNHNPYRSHGAPYLNRDDSLQQIINRNNHVVFISGHTHISPCCECGCVEYDPERSNIYLNNGSVVPTQLKTHDLAPRDWTNGVIMELIAAPNGLDVCVRSASNGLCIPQGFYQIRVDNSERVALER